MTEQPFTLVDLETPGPRTVRGRVVIKGGQVRIFLDDLQDPQRSFEAVTLELADDRVRAIVWNSYEADEPTHRIPLQAPINPYRPFGRALPLRAKVGWTSVADSPAARNLAGTISEELRTQLYAGVTNPLYRALRTIRRPIDTMRIPQ